MSNRGRMSQQCRGQIASEPRKLVERRTSGDLTTAKLTNSIPSYPSSRMNPGFPSAPGFPTAEPAGNEATHRRGDPTAPKSLRGSRMLPPHRVPVLPLPIGFCRAEKGEKKAGSAAAAPGWPRHSGRIFRSASVLISSRISTWGFTAATPERARAPDPNRFRRHPGEKGTARNPYVGEKTGCRYFFPFDKIPFPP